uniref:BUB1 N-terminal domain-containing protein n=1 Tax=Kalanchoe fedtschenkoi TaxID=63787 RepID=A0A7N0REV8_KALFE
MADARYNDLFASLISEIKSYTGKDPLMPWLRGIRRMRECLPPQVLKAKLPRFLQKCAEAFQADRRYRNDTRYLRVWLQLMDYAGNPKGILRTMEMNHIGLKRALFYQAYALYYEKMKKYDEAEKMYKTGVQNLAEPLDELQKSYQQFIHRMERHNKKKIQRQQWWDVKRKPLSETTNIIQTGDSEDNNENIRKVKCQPKQVEERSHSLEQMNSKHSESAIGKFGPESNSKGRLCTNKVRMGSNITCGEDTVIVRFVDKAIVGKSEAEDACHHGLVEPTINMKEAMDSINNMFREPLDPFINNRKSQKSHPKVEASVNAGFQVYEDNCADNIGELTNHAGNDPEPFEIYIDDEGSSEVKEKNHRKSEQCENQNVVESPVVSDSSEILFPVSMKPPSECSADGKAGSTSKRKFKEDTVVFKFVGSTTVDEPEVVENVCHHGLVEPTVNMKEAMNDINNMFGKPMDFVRSRRTKKQVNAVSKKDNISDVFSILPDDDPMAKTKEDSSVFSILPDEEEKPINQIHCGGFSILPDDNLKSMVRNRPPNPSQSTRDSELFEPTVFTKEAIDEINKMFGMPLDF